MKKIFKIILVMVMMLTTFISFSTDVNAAGSRLKVTTLLTDSPYTRTFVVTNPTDQDISYDFTVSGDGATNGKGSVLARQSTKHTFNTESGSITFKLKDSEGNYSPAYQSESSYNVRVYYRAGNIELKAMTYAKCTKTSPAKASAPASINYNGREYVISGPNYREVSYGSEEVSFEYVLQTRPDFTSNIVFVDQDGNILKRDTFTVSDGIGGTYANVPNQLTHNNRTYKLMDGYGPISQTYEQGIKTHYLRYQLQSDTSKLPYYITVDYKAGDILLTRKTITVQNGSTVNHEAPKYYKVGTAAYQLTGNNKITHTFGQDDKQYVINYTKYETSENTPYDVMVNYVDVATGKVLQVHKKTVDVNKTITFNISGSIKVDNKTYILSAKQPTSIDHKFGSKEKEYTVYYHEKDIDITSYEVTVSYYNLTENKVMYTTKLTANIDSMLKIDVPQEYNNNGNNYVLLSNQATSYEHDFYSRRRNYTMVYRDVNDIYNQNVVVIETATGVIFETPNGTLLTVDNTTGTTLITNPDGTVDTIDQDGNIVPYQEPVTEIIEDNETPLSKGSKNDKKNSDNTAFIVGTSLAIVAVIVGIIIFIIKRRKVSI